jgi:protein-S-isoprenylcysteine O-methyltransferase Ste14
MHRWQLWLTAPVFTALVAVVLFGSAGRWDLPYFWAYVALLLVLGLITAGTADLELMSERLRPGPGGKDNLTALRLLGLSLFAGHFAVAGLDVGRFHWSDTVPAGAQIAGLVGLAFAFAIMRWAQHVNRFFSSAMRIQWERGHHVITAGPYRYVRHPGYVAFILAGLCSGVALGSWWSLLLPLVCVVVFVRRTAREDRLLQAELEGYTEYARKVRYRLIPGVW